MLSSRSREQRDAVRGSVLLLLPKRLRVEHAANEHLYTSNVIYDRQLFVLLLLVRVPLINELPALKELQSE